LPRRIWPRQEHAVTPNATLSFEVAGSFHSVYSARFTRLLVSQLQHPLIAPTLLQVFAGEDGQYRFEERSSEFFDPISNLALLTGGQWKDRLDAFRKSVREFRFLLDMLRHGRAHDPDENRMDHTGEGALAVICPACPHPGKNMPHNLVGRPS
jgi:hypothetical protein